MSGSRTYIVFELWVLFCFAFYQNTIGVQVTRYEGGDQFPNPNSGCKYGDAKKFCSSANSTCYSTEDRRCCYCKCGRDMATFNVTNLQCAPDQAFRQGCKVKFDDDKSNLPIELLDLTKNDDEKIYWETDDYWDDVKSFSILSIYSYNDRKKMDNFVKEKQKGHKKEDPKWKKGFWEAKIEWDNLNFHLYGGRVFRVEMSYEVEKKDKSFVTKYDCFVFKSKGSIPVTFPKEPLTTPSPTTEKPTIKKSTTSTTKKSTTSTTQELTSTTKKPTSTTKKPTSTTKKPTSTTKKSTTSTTQESISTSILQSSTVPFTTDEVLTTASSLRKTANNKRPTRNTPPTRKPTDPEEPHVSSSAELVPENERQSSEKKEKKVVYIIVAVVVIVIVIALTVVVCFTMKRQKIKKTLKKRESRANIIMSDMNKNNINENEDEFYTALDKSTRNDDSNYQALTSPGANKNKPIVNAYSEKEMCQMEDNYVYVDTDNVYSTIDPQINDRKVGAKSNDAFNANEDERVYSILEQYPNQVDYTTPNTGDDRVYSILEKNPGQIAYPAANGKLADQRCTVDVGSDYVTILPPKVERGQSDPPVYAALSGERAKENEYQSLQKKSKK